MLRLLVELGFSAMKRIVRALLKARERSISMATILSLIRDSVEQVLFRLMRQIFIMVKLLVET